MASTLPGFARGESPRGRGSMLSSTQMKPNVRRRPPLLVALSLAALGCGPCGFQQDPGLKVVVPAMPTTLDWSTSDPTSWVNYPVMLATQKGLTALDPATHEV